MAQAVEEWYKQMPIITRSYLTAAVVTTVGCSLDCAHVMAMAVQKLFPDAKVTIGPWIDNGFYYDFDMEPLTDKDLKRIKKEMVSF